jgi:hypothetical protein
MAECSLSRESAVRFARRDRVLVAIANGVLRLASKNYQAMLKGSIIARQGKTAVPHAQLETAENFLKAPTARKQSCTFTAAGLPRLRCGWNPRPEWTPNGSPA